MDRTLKEKGRRHFGSNLDIAGLGASSQARRPERGRELTAQFTYLLESYPEAASFASGSQLHNLRSRGKLFPCLVTPHQGCTFILTHPIVRKRSDREINGRASDSRA